MSEEKKEEEEENQNERKNLVVKSARVCSEATVI